MGTVFAVTRGPDKTCICVLEGRVVATLPDGTRHEIEAGRRLTLIGDQLETGAMIATEAHELEDLRGRALTLS